MLNHPWFGFSKMESAMVVSPTINERWLRCKVDKGMFSDEVAVTYPASGTVLMSVFVPKSAVEGTPGGIGRVRVLLASRDSRAVALPTEYQDVIPVSESDLSEIP
jgi:hypothetical protein